MLLGSQEDRTLYWEFSWAHEMIPVWNPTSILNMALLAMILSVAHVARVRASAAPESSEEP